MDASRSAATTAYVERVAEQTAISGVIDGAAHGRAGALLISGDAGVGKTAVVERVSSRAGQGVVVLSGGCLPLSAQSVPFLALMSALRSADPGLGPPAGLMEHGGLATHVPVAFDRWLSDLCRERSVVLTIDDLHWADQSTLDVLMYVLAGPADRALAVIATIRGSEIGEVHPLQHWLADVRRLPRVEEVNLGPLDRVETAEQLAGLMHTTPHQSLVDDVFARTCGNAYLNRLLAKNLEPDARSLPRDFPADLTAAVLQSWRMLPAATRDLTRILAAGGGPLTVGDVLTVSGLAIDGDAAAGSLMAAVDAGVVDRARDGRLWFHHPLIAEVLEDNLTDDERTRWHAAFAVRAEQLIESSSAPTPDVIIAAADHHDRAGQVAQAYRWALRAAESAGGSGGAAEELRLLRRAMELGARVPGAQEAERDVLQRMMAAATAAGAHREELEAVERLLGVLDPQTEPLMTAELLVRGANLKFRTGRAFDLRADHQRAVDQSATADPASWQHAYALAGLAGYIAWFSDPEADSLADHALAVARRCHSNRALSFALSAKAAVLCFQGQFAECTRLAGEAVVAAVEARDFYAFFCGAVWEMNATMSVGDAAAAAHMGRRREQLVALGAPHADCAVLSAMEADGWFMAGDWRACQDRLRDALGADPGPLADVNARLTAARLAAWQGRTVEAHGHLARADELYADGSIYLPFAFDASRATVALAAGDAEGAVAAVLARIALPDSPHMGWWLMPLGARALADLIEDDRRAGQDPHVNVARLNDLTQRFPSVSFVEDEEFIAGDLMGPALNDLYEAEIGRARRSSANSEQWERATTSCHDAALVWEEAYACWRWAESLLAHGHPSREQGAMALRRGLALADELRTEPIRTELVALAKTARIPIDGVEVVPASAPAGLPGLTAREDEILAHVVAGRTYREIAHALQISEKTVSSHISNLLRKTGADNRIDLARLANHSPSARGAAGPSRSR